MQIILHEILLFFLIRNDEINAIKSPTNIVIVTNPGTVRFNAIHNNKNKIDNLLTCSYLYKHFYSSFFIFCIDAEIMSIINRILYILISNLISIKYKIPSNTRKIASIKPIIFNILILFSPKHF